MTRAVFQAGLSWAFIAARWPAYESAFDGFDARTVAAYDATAIDRLMNADGVVHSRSKIAGTIANAAALLALDAEGRLATYSTTFASWDALMRDVKQRFAYVGNLSAYYWCLRTGQRVPRREAWQTTEKNDHPRIREMVEMARAEGVSSEVDDAAFPLR